MPLDTSIPLQVQAPQFMDPTRAMSMVAEQQMNALRSQALQQDMQRNALTMQNTMEDRARAANERAQAAKDKAAEKALRARILQESGGDATKASDIALRLGRPDIAESYAKGRESIAKAGTEEAGFKLKDMESAVTELSPIIASVNSPDSAAQAARIMYRHPTLGKIFSQFMPEDQFVMESAKSFAADPNTWRLQHSISGKDLFDTVTKLNQANQPKPESVATGAAVVDMNPQSPTYGQTIVKGAPSEQELKIKAKEEGKTALDETLTRLGEEYAALNNMGAAPSEKKSWLENIPARATASRVGQSIGVNPEAQTRIQNISGLRQDLIRAIKNASGMSAQEMNSNVELQTLLNAATDPTQNIESIKTRLSDLSKRYGLGKDFSKILGKQTESAGNNTVTTPDGRVFTFKSAEDAAKFKAAAGL